MLTKRTNILFDEQLWKRLLFLAQKQNTSVGELVRTAARKQYSEEEQIRQIEEALAGIKKFRERYGGKLGKGEDSVIFLRKMRNERYGKNNK